MALSMRCDSRASSFLGVTEFQKQPKMCSVAEKSDICRVHTSEEIRGLLDPSMELWPLIPFSVLSSSLLGIQALGFVSQGASSGFISSAPERHPPFL